jgi:predicted N-acyltransferase
MRHPDLAGAVARFVATEAQAVRETAAQYEEMSPYRRAGETDE